jgi:hypothetical protein
MIETMERSFATLLSPTHHAGDLSPVEEHHRLMGLAFAEIDEREGVVRVVGDQQPSRP